MIRKILEIQMEEIHHQLIGGFYIPLSIRLSTCFNHPKGQDFTSIHSKVFVNTMGCV
jgi:hypothetical protein